MSNPGSSSPPKLPVFSTVAGVYRFVWGHRSEYLNLVLPAVVILSLLQVVFGLSNGETDIDGGDFASSRGTVGLFLVLNFFFVTLIAVAWHRRFLMPTENPTFFSQLRWRMRHTRFAMLSIGIALLAFAVMIMPLIVISSMPQAVALPGTVMLIIALYLMIVRWMLALPASAIDKKMSLLDAWRLGNGNSWRLVGMTLLANIPISVASLLVLQIVTNAMGIETGMLGRFVTIFVGELFSFTAVVVGVSILSSAFHRLDRNRGANPGLPVVDHE